jgi:hypothetical protein
MNDQSTISWTAVNPASHNLAIRQRECEPAGASRPAKLGGSPRDAMFTRLQEIVLDGLQHGFFDCQITCEVVQERKRRVTIKAGKSHQFMIRAEDLQG